MGIEMSWLILLGLGGVWSVVAGVAEASTLGWATVAQTIFTEIRNVGIVCFGGALVIAGIELFFQKHLDRLGHTMAALGAGGALVATGSQAGVSLLGVAGGAVLGSTVHVVGLSEATGDILGTLLYGGMLLGTLAAVWREGQRYGK